jgi:PAP2 superfamily
MRDNNHFTAIFSAMWRLLSAPAHPRQDPGVGGFANTVGEKATCDKRNLHRLIAWSLAAMFALAGSAATAESPLTGENANELARLLAVPGQKLAVSCSDRTPPRAPVSTFDRYLLWNEIALDTTAIDHTGDPASCFGEQLGPPRSARAMAIIHIAMFDAENAITKKFVSYSGIPAVSGNVSRDRAIAQAAHDTLVALYPSQKDRIDAIFNADIATIQGTQAAIDAGAALGTQAASAILASRQKDRSEMPEPRWFSATPPGDYFPIGYPNVQPGIWQVDPVSMLGVALGGNWPKVKPFVMTSADQFRAPQPPQPPFLTNQAFSETFNEEVRIGGDPTPPHFTNTSRTEHQTFIAKFWAYDGTPGLCAPPRLYNMVARTIALQQKMRTVPEIARLFALVNVALADAGLASWETKYFYQYWRPVTAIRLLRDPNFYPLGGQATNTAGPNFTPPFPSYTSGHATFGGALFQILRKFFPDETPFTFVSDEWNGLNKDVNGHTRHLRPASFKSFTQAEWQNAQSRLYMGIHWHFDAEKGIEQGNQVADFVFDHAFRPVDETDESR